MNFSSSYENGVIIVKETLSAETTVSESQEETLTKIPEAFSNSNIWIKINDKPKTLSMLLNEAKNSNDKDSLKRISDVFEADFFRGNMMYNITAKKAPKMWDLRNKMSQIQQSLLLIPKIKLILLEEDEQKIIENEQDPFKELLYYVNNKDIINKSQIEVVKDLNKKVNLGKDIESHQEIRNIIQVQNLKVDWYQEEITSKEAKLEIFLEHEQLIKTRVIKYLTSPGARVRLEVSYENIIGTKETWDAIFPGSQLEYSEYEAFCKASKQELTTKDKNNVDSLIDWSIFKFAFIFNEDKSVTLNLELVQAGFTAIKENPNINVIQLLSPKVINYFKIKNILKISTGNKENNVKENIWISDVGIDTKLKQKTSKRTGILKDNSNKIIDKEEIDIEIKKSAYLVADMPRFIIHLIWLYAFEYKKLFDKKELKELNKNFIISFDVDMKENASKVKRYDGALINQMPKIPGDKTGNDKISLSLFNYQKVQKYLNKNTTLAFKYKDKHDESTDKENKYYTYEFNSAILSSNSGSYVYNELLNSNAQYSLVEKKINKDVVQEIPNWENNKGIFNKVARLKLKKEMLTYFNVFNNTVKINTNIYLQYLDESELNWNFKYLPYNESFLKETGIWLSDLGSHGEQASIIRIPKRWANPNTFYRTEEKNNDTYHFYKKLFMLPIYNKKYIEAIKYFITPEKTNDKDWLENPPAIFKDWMYTYSDFTKPTSLDEKQRQDYIKIDLERGLTSILDQINKIQSQVLKDILANDPDFMTINFIYHMFYNYTSESGELLGQYRTIKTLAYFYKDISHKLNTIRVDSNLLSYLTNGLVERLIAKQGDISIGRYIEFFELLISKIIKNFNEEINNIDEEIYNLTHEANSWVDYYNHYQSSIWKTKFTNNDEPSENGWYKELDKPIDQFIKNALIDTVKDKVDYFVKFNNESFKEVPVDGGWNSAIKTKVLKRGKEENYKINIDNEFTPAFFELPNLTNDPEDNFLNINDANATKKIENTRKNVSFKTTESDEARDHINDYLDSLNSFSMVTEIKNKEYRNSLSGAQYEFYKMALGSEDGEWLEIKLSDFNKSILTEEDNKTLLNLQNRILSNMDQDEIIFINHNYDHNVISMNFTADYLSDMPYKLGLYSESVKKDNELENAQKIKKLKNIIKKKIVITNQAENNRIVNTLNIMELISNSDNNEGSNIRNILNWADNNSDLSHAEMFKELNNSPIWSDKLLEDTSTLDTIYSLYDMMNYNVSVKSHFVPDTKIYMPTFIYSGGKEVLDLQEALSKEDSIAEDTEWAKLIIDKVSPQTGLYKVTKFGWEINKYGEWISSFEGLKYEIGFLNLVNKIWFDNEAQESSMLTFEELDTQSNFFNTNFIIENKDYTKNLMPRVISNYELEDMTDTLEELIFSGSISSDVWLLDSFLLLSDNNKINEITQKHVKTDPTDELIKKVDYLTGDNGLENIISKNFDYKTSLKLYRQDHKSLSMSNTIPNEILFDVSDKKDELIDRVSVLDNSWMVNLLYSDKLLEKIDKLADCPYGEESTWSEYINPSLSAKLWLDENRLSHNYVLDETDIEDYLHYRFIRYTWYFLANIAEDFFSKGFKKLNTETFEIDVENKKIKILEYDWEPTKDADGKLTSIKFEEEYNLYFNDFFTEFAPAIRNSWNDWIIYYDNLKSKFDDYVATLKNLEWPEQEINNEFASMIESKLKGKYLELKKDNTVSVLKELRAFIMDWRNSKQSEYDKIKETHSRFIFNFDFIKLPNNIEEWKLIKLSGINFNSQKEEVYLNMSLGQFIKRFKRLDEHINLSSWSNIKPLSFMNEKWFENKKVEDLFKEKKSFSADISWDNTLKNLNENYYKIETENTSEIEISFDKSRNKYGKSVNDYRNKYGKLSFSLDNNEVYKYNSFIKDNTWNIDLLHDIDNTNWEEKFNRTRSEHAHREDWEQVKNDLTAQGFISYTQLFTGEAYPEDYKDSL
jgi:hypothetical protein